MVTWRVLNENARQRPPIPLTNLPCHWSNHDNLSYSPTHSPTAGCLWPAALASLIRMLSVTVVHAATVAPITQLALTCTTGVPAE